MSLPRNLIIPFEVSKLVVGFPLIFMEASGGIFIVSVTRYDTFVMKPEGSVKLPLI